MASSLYAQYSYSWGTGHDIMDIIGIIKTHGRVSAAKKAVWRTRVLFSTGTPNLLTPRIPISTELISIKFAYFIPSIYATLHTKCERNQPSS